MFSPDHLTFSGWVEDCILLLLLVLGGDHNTVKDYCTNFGSERLSKCYLPANELDWEAEWAVYDNDMEDGIVPDFDLAGYATDDVPFQAMQLLGNLKLLNDYNAYAQGLEVYQETRKLRQLLWG